MAAPGAAGLIAGWPWRTGAPRDPSV